MLDPPKLTEILEHHFIPERVRTKQTEYLYRHAVKALAVSLGYQPTARDLREPVIAWLENRLTMMGHGDKYVREVSIRVRTLANWIALRRVQGGAFI